MLRITLHGTFVVSFILVLMLDNSAFSQSLATTDVVDEWSLDNESEVLFGSTVDKNLYYVDMELLDGGLSDIQVLNAEAEVIDQYSIKDIPKDALFELDLNHIQKGNYLIRIRSYLEEIKKDITIE